MGSVSDQVDYLALLSAQLRHIPTWRFNKRRRLRNLYLTGIAEYRDLKACERAMLGASRAN